MNAWFLVKMVFKIECGEGLHRPQYDEQWRLLSAENAILARQKANRMGKEESHAPSDVIQVVRWHYMGASAIIPLQGIADGAEVLTTIREPWDEDYYLQELKRDMDSISAKPHSLIL